MRKFPASVSGVVLKELVVDLNNVSCILPVNRTSRGVQVYSTLLLEMYTLSALGHKYSHSGTLRCLVIVPDSKCVGRPMKEHG